MMDKTKEAVYAQMRAQEDAIRKVLIEHKINPDDREEVEHRCELHYLPLEDKTFVVIDGKRVAVIHSEVEGNLFTRCKEMRQE